MKVLVREKIAEAGNRVVIHDRRNTGRSSIAIEGDSENEEWAEDLRALRALADTAVYTSAAREVSMRVDGWPGALRLADAILRLGR